MRTLTVRIQAALMSGPAPRRSGGRRLIAGRRRYQHAATCMAHFSSAPSMFSIVSFAGCQWGRACCCSPEVSIHEECRSPIQPEWVQRGGAGWYRPTDLEAGRAMSNNTVYNVWAGQTLSSCGANDVYELTQSTEKRSQFLISFWKGKKKEKKKRNPSKTFPLIQNNGTHLPDKTSATRIWGKLKRCTKKWNKKINPQNKRLTTCQSAPKSCHSISTHCSPLSQMSSNSRDVEKVHRSECLIYVLFPPKLNTPSMANSRAGMVSICSTLSMAGLFCRLCGHLWGEKTKMFC